MMDYWIIYDPETREHKAVGKPDDATGLKTFFASKDRRETEKWITALCQLPPSQRPQ